MAIQASMGEGTESIDDGSSIPSGVSIRFSPSPSPSNMQPDQAGTTILAPMSLGLANLPPSIESKNSVEPESPAVDLTTVRRRAKSKDRPTIPLSQANRLVGRNLRIVAADGMDVVAVLARADGDVLTFERPLSAGVMSFKLRKQEIATLRAAD